MFTTLTGLGRCSLLAVASTILAASGVAGPTTASATTWIPDGGAGAHHPVPFDVGLYVAERKAAWAQDKI